MSEGDIPKRPTSSRILVLNGGSSSLKFAVFEPGSPPRRLVGGRFERIGQPGTQLVFSLPSESKSPVDAPDASACLSLLEKRLQAECPGGFAVVGHRIVHGGDVFPEHRVMGDAQIDALESIASYAPEHLPSEIAILRAARKLFPGSVQVGCFDTVFHRSLPPVATRLPLPRRYHDAGIRRYGFHGLSYAYLLGEVQRLCGEKKARERIIFAHLGNGASMAAVKDGQCQETTMGFTPAAGLMMGTRTGDLDPGVVRAIMERDSLSPAQFDRLINHDSGLLGVSGSSADMRDLLASRHSDARAAAAFDMFCYHARGMIGRLATVLGGIDLLVFSAGIGEHCPEVRQEICQGLEFLGVEICERRNAAAEKIISASGRPVEIRVIPTDEESEIVTISSQLAGSQM